MNNHKSKSLLTVFLVLIMVAAAVSFSIPATASSDASSEPAVDYTFNGVLTDSKAKGDALENVDTTNNTFATESVNGVSKNVLVFGAAGGLKLTNINKFLSNNGTYTIELTARINATSWYSKILDYKNRTSDDGLYLFQDNTIKFYPEAGGTLINNTDYFKIGVTRDNTTNEIGVFINGVKQMTINDADGKGIISAENILYFFTDDTSVVDNNAGGAVSEIKVYNTAFSDSDMEELSADKIASVTTSGGATSDYSTVQAAINAASTQNGSTLKLLKNINVTSALSVTSASADFTLDLSGYKLTGSFSSEEEGVIIVENGILSVKDSATGGLIKNTYTTNTTGSGIVLSGGALKLYSGTIEAAGQAIYIIKAGSKLNMSGGTIYGYGPGASSEGIAIEADAATDSTKITISGGYLGRFSSSSLLVWCGGTPSNVSWTITGGYYDLLSIQISDFKSYATIATGYDMNVVENISLTLEESNHIFGYHVEPINALPTLTVSTPSANFSDAYAGGTVSFSGTVADTDNTTGTEIYYQIDSLSAVQAYTFTGVPGVFNANVTLPSDLSVGVHTVKIYAQDSAGGISASITKTINILAKSSTCDITGSTTQSNTEIGTDTITASVPNSTKSMKVDFTVSNDATWKLYSDAACTKEVTDKTLSLSVGDNTAYVKVTAQDGTTKIYELTITRAEASNNTATDNPKTSDTGPIVLYVALLFTSLAAVTSVAFKKKRLNR